MRARSSTHCWRRARSSAVSCRGSASASPRRRCTTRTGSCGVHRSSTTRCRRRPRCRRSALRSSRRPRRTTRSARKGSAKAARSARSPRSPTPSRMRSDAGSIRRSPRRSSGAYSTGKEKDVSETADIVVAGAGHNSLIAAAYLAKAGFECIVLDARATPGGGASSEELLGPGYLIDSCSTGHTLIQPNPVLRDDELGMKADYGLEYVSPDPVAHVVFPDGESLTHWLDLDRTSEELTRFSARDADAYRRLLHEYDEIKPAVAAYRFNPIG